MSKSSRVVVAVLCITAGLCLPQLAAAAEQVIFHADFDADAPGTFPNPNPPGPPAGDSIVIYPLDNTVMVGPPGVYGFSTNFLLLYATGPGGTGLSPYFRGFPDPAFGPFNSGQYVVTWTSETLDSSYGDGFATVLDDLGLPAFTVTYYDYGIDPLPTILYRDGSGVQSTGVGFLPMVPQNFRAVVDLDLRVFDLSIDGVQVATARPFQNNTFDRVAAFAWEIDGMTTERFAIDNITITMVTPAGPADSDGDGVPDTSDNCPSVYNREQVDTDGDLIGDVCDKCPLQAGPAANLGCPAGADVPQITVWGPLPPSGILEGTVAGGGSIPVTFCFDLDPQDLFTGKYTFPPDAFNTEFRLSLNAGTTVADPVNPALPISLQPRCVVGPPYRLQDPAECDASGEPGCLRPVKNPDSLDGTWCVSVDVAERYHPDTLAKLVPNPGDFLVLNLDVTHAQLVRDVETCDTTGGDPNGLPCFNNVWYGVVDGTIPLVLSNGFNVEIDIRPGAYPNIINLGSNANVPVAILSTSGFYAPDLVPNLDTVTLGDALVRKVKGRGSVYSISDVNGDGINDLLVHFEVTGMDLSADDTRVFLKGMFVKDGKSVFVVGSDSVKVVAAP